MLRLFLAYVWLAALTAVSHAHGPLAEQLAAADSFVQSQPGEASLLLLRAELHRLSGQLDRAETDLEKVSWLAPHLAEAELVRAALQLDRDQPREALDPLDLYLAARPTSAPARRLRAQTLAALGRLEEAVEEMDRLVAGTARPRPEDYWERARLLDALGESFLERRVAGLVEGVSRLGPVPAFVSELERLGRLGTSASSQETSAVMPRSAPAVATESHANSPSTAAAALTRGPYLQLGTPVAITVRWRTDVGSDSRVRFGASPDALDLEIADAALTTEHEVRLTGLAPSTRYFYSVGSTTEALAGGDLTHFFWTAPPPGALRRSRVWVIGDSGQPGANQRLVRDAYYAYTGNTPTDVWLMLGDNAYGSGTDSEYQAAVFDVYQNLLRTTVLWPTRGNHDALHAGGNNDYYDLFTLPSGAEAGGLLSGTEAYYSFDFANVHFVCLDSQGSARTPGSPMLVWLAADLQATLQDWIVAYWHHPPYSKGSHDSDAESQLIQMREYVLPVLEAGGVDLVLTGHSHSYERSILLDEHYGYSSSLHDSMVVNGGNGRPWSDGAYAKPSGPHEGTVYGVVGCSSHTSGGPLDHPVMVTALDVLGSLVLDFEDNRVDAVFLDASGLALDQFTIVKGVPSAGPAGPLASSPLTLRVVSNPARQGAHLAYSLPRPGRARVVIRDASGRQVITLEDGLRADGPRLTAWNGRDAGGRRVASGVYFATLEFETQRLVAKLVVVR